MSRKRDEYSELDDDELRAQVVAYRRRLLTPATAAALNYADALATWRMRSAADIMLGTLLSQHRRMRR